jgi:hypothetical protein
MTEQQGASAVEIAAVLAVLTLFSQSNPVPATWRARRQAAVRSTAARRRS